MSRKKILVLGWAGVIIGSSLLAYGLIGFVMIFL